MKRIGLVYLPEPEVSTACVVFADHVTALGGRRTTLGEYALPHVTLVHVEGVDDAEAAWEEARELIPATMMMSLPSFSMSPYLRPYNATTGAPGVGAFIDVRCTAALRKAEKAALGLSWAKNKTVVSGNGDNFWPHITLGVLERYPNDVAMPTDLIGRSKVSGRLALGPIGPHGVFIEEWFSK